MISRRHFLQTSASASALIAVPVLANPPARGGVLTPEMFGAKGDGRTDDSAAFAALSDHINAKGGGAVSLRRTTYLVGVQRRGADGMVQPARLMEFQNCTRPIVIDGNGARIRCADGQRYGMFEPDGSPVAGKVDRKRRVGKLTPYVAMIAARRCAGGITIANLELDGNQAGHILGGKYGDKGWQIGCGGIFLRDNKGPETLTNIHSHDHAWDGFYIDGPAERTPGVRRRFTGLKADRNGRQGMSICGGSDYEIVDSTFTRTGRGKIASAPGAGVDIEAERRKLIRNLHFSKCRFEDNRGCGVVADTGDSADIAFDDCAFIGTSAWSVWARKPGMRFTRCLFLGSVVHAFGDPDPARAGKFIQCTFTDDPKLSPTGAIFYRKQLSADLSAAQNVLFDHCNFVLRHGALLPWSIGPIWNDCTMEQRATDIAHPRGTFRGVNRITGSVSLGDSTIEGTVFLNGQVYHKKAG